MGEHRHCRWLTIEQARDQARAVIRRIKFGKSSPMAPQSTAAVARLG